jgi:hypothetical protein
MYAGVLGLDHSWAILHHCHGGPPAWRRAWPRNFSWDLGLRSKGRNEWPAQDGKDLHRPAN